MHPTYDVTKSTQWNIDNGPLFDSDLPVRDSFPNPIKLWDFNLNSPLGVPAGPLFNSKFIKLYADLGFDTLVYKTVRSIHRNAHPNPNIVFVNTQNGITKDQMGKTVTTQPEPDDIRNLTITNSFGVNSSIITDWQTDFAKAKTYMHPGQLLILSCMGTHGLERKLVDDYVYTASVAKDAGAEVIELNYSCPNLKGGKSGAIFMDPETSSQISQKVKKAIGNIPLVIKLGYYKDKELLAEIIKKNAPHVDGIAAINTIKMQVKTPEGEQALPGQGRLTSGLCGSAIKPFALETIQDISNLKLKNNYDFEILGGGGITQATDIDQLLATGAKLAMAATAAMWNPYLAKEYNDYRVKN